ncbi:MAG: hypothetical protein KGI67_04385 [Pseudomonadota bacterium]|nr:hypothetical protein [Pseudomonadota bacterium]
MIRRACWALLLCLGCVAIARADYSVGRLSAVSGQVYVQTPGDPESHAASLNEVLAEGDQLSTWDGASVELQFAGVLVEVAADSVLALSRVGSDQIALYLAQGSVAVARLSARQPGTLQLQGPASLAELLSPGRMRLSVWPDSGQEWLSVHQGRVHAEADQNSLTLYAGQGLQLFPAAGGPATSITAAAPEDPVDLALLDADQRLRASAIVQHLGGDWVGAAALDDQGEWMDVSSVGPLWVPQFLPSGWAPYRQGHWQWNAVWGWSWIDDLPWAWMPFHYGRWIWWNNRWAWSPQGRVPVFSAACPAPAGISVPPLPGPWQPGGRQPLAGIAATRVHALAVPPAGRATPANTAPPVKPGVPAASVRRPNPVSSPPPPTPPAIVVPAPPPARPALRASEPATENHVPPLRNTPPPAGIAPRSLPPLPPRGPGEGPGAGSSGHPQHPPGAFSGAARPPGEAPASRPSASEGAWRKPE